jgi:hypothetical protein
MRNHPMIALVAMALAACTDTAIGPPVTVASGLAPTAAWGPETPNFNLEVVLRGQGFGLVTFRQPNDDALIINLDTWVRDLTPNASYRLQRAVDTTIDGTCTSTSWLTLGKGLTPATIDTDERGTGRAELFRSVAAFPVGSRFDIHFQVVDANTGAVVLQSDCYTFTISS